MVSLPKLISDPAITLRSTVLTSKVENDRVIAQSDIDRIRKRTEVT
jgi:hypothetical protein